MCKNKSAKAYGDFASPRYNVDLSPCYLSYASRYYIICILLMFRKWFNHRLRIRRSLVCGNSHGSLPWHTLVNIVEFSLCRIFDMVHCRNTVHVYSRWESVYDTVQYIYGEKHLRGQQSLYKRKRTLPRGWWISSMRPKAIEGWPSTAPRLAGWRRVTRQVWFCLWWTGRAGCPDRRCPAEA